MKNYVYKAIASKNVVIGDLGGIRLLSGSMIDLASYFTSEQIRYSDDLALAIFRKQVSLLDPYDREVTGNSLEEVKNVLKRSYVAPENYGSTSETLVSESSYTWEGEDLMPFNYYYGNFTVGKDVYHLNSMLRKGDVPDEFSGPYTKLGVDGWYIGAFREEGSKLALTDVFNVDKEFDIEDYFPINSVSSLRRNPNFGSGYTARAIYETTSANGAGCKIYVNSVYDGRVKQIAIRDGGSGYLPGETVTLTGGGFNCMIEIIGVINQDDKEGIVSSCRVYNDDGGRNYTVSENNSTTTSGNGGTGLTIDILTIDNGVVEHFSIVNKGAGYTVNDVITLSGGNNDAEFIVDYLEAYSLPKWGNVAQTYLRETSKDGSQGFTFTFFEGNYLWSNPDSYNTFIKFSLSVDKDGKFQGDKKYFNFSERKRIDAKGAVSYVSELTRNNIGILGKDYEAGNVYETSNVDPSSQGSGCTVQVNSVINGAITSVSDVRIDDGGVNFREGDLIGLQGASAGMGANLYVGEVDESGSILSFSSVLYYGDSYSLGSATGYGGNGSGLVVDVLNVSNGVPNEYTLVEKGEGYNFGDDVILVGGDNKAKFSVNNLGYRTNLTNVNENIVRMDSNYYANSSFMDPNVYYYVTENTVDHVFSLRKYNYVSDEITVLIEDIQTLWESSTDEPWLRYNRYYGDLTPPYVQWVIHHPGRPMMLVSWPGRDDYSQHNYLVEFSPDRVTKLDINLTDWSRPMYTKGKIYITNIYSEY